MRAVTATARRPGWWPGWPKARVRLRGGVCRLIVLVRLLGVTALAIWLVLGRPVIFTQRRPAGTGGLFMIYKFRTMSNARGPTASSCRIMSGRLTRLGGLLRRTSIDELPELINVIRGDMA